MGLCTCRRFFYLFLFFIWVTPNLLLAIPSAQVDDSEEPTLREILVNKDIQISNSIDRAAKKVDSALSGEPIPKKPNLTHIIVGQRLDYEIGGISSYNPYLDVRLSLPNLEKKWQLKFTTYDEDQVQRGINQNRLQTVPIRQTYGGDIGFFQKLGNISTEFQPRVELRDGLQTSYILKFSSATHYPSFTFFPELQLFAKSDQGVGEFLSFNSDVPLYKSYVLSLINEEQYVDQDNVFSTNSGLRLSHDYNQTMKQMYAVIFESSSRTTYHLDRYTLQFGFSHKLIQNVIHYTIMPYLLFSRDYAFRGTPGMILDVDVIF